MINACGSPRHRPRKLRKCGMGKTRWSQAMMENYTKMTPPLRRSSGAHKKESAAVRPYAAAWGTEGAGVVLGAVAAHAVAM